MKVTQSTNNLTDAVSKGIRNATRSAAIDPAKNTKILTDVLNKPKIDFVDRKIILSSISKLNNGTTASRIIKAVGSAVGRVVTKMEARKILETRLNAKTAQQALKSNENIQKAAIDAGLWNNGINYSTDTDSKVQDYVAPGSDGKTQTGTTGSFIGG